MGAIQGFRLDANGDGRISQKEFEKAKKLGLDVSYMDKDNDGKVDAGVTSKNNSVYVDNEERIYEGNNIDKKGNFAIRSTSIFTGSGGTKWVQKQDEVIVSRDLLNKMNQVDE